MNPVSLRKLALGAVLFVGASSAHAQLLGRPASVTVTNGPSNPVPVNANVTNNSDHPVPVVVQNQGVFTPVQVCANLDFSRPSNQTAATFPYTVPNGQRLLIHYFSATGPGLASSYHMVLEVGTTLNGNSVLQNVPTMPDSNQGRAAAPVYFVADGGTQVSVQMLLTLITPSDSGGSGLACFDGELR